MKHFEKQRLLKLAGFLQRLPKRLFDLSLILDVQKPENGFSSNCSLSTAIKCGTTACAIGWAPSVFPRHLKWDHENSCVALKNAKKDDIYDSYEDGDIDFGAAEIFFGIDEEQAQYLFDPCFYDENAQTAKDVARRIKEFVKNDGALPQSFYDDKEENW